MGLTENAIELTKALRNGVVEVKFTKKDGSERIMICTTKFDLIPEDKRPKPQTTEQPAVPTEEKSPKKFNVFELFNGWRSFNESQLQTWKSN